MSRDLSTSGAAPSARDGAGPTGVPSAKHNPPATAHPPAEAVPGPDDGPELAQALGQILDLALPRPVVGLPLRPLRACVRRSDGLRIECEGTTRTELADALLRSLGPQRPGEDWRVSLDLQLRERGEPAVGGGRRAAPPSLRGTRARRPGAPASFGPT